jgi:ectoine hydroxylase-related dioxygenase (phytanoyl-CoA dioxygenase family)
VLGRDGYERSSYLIGVRDQSLPPVPDFDANRDSFDISSWDYEPGDVIVFHGHVLHSALGDVVSERASQAASVAVIVRNWCRCISR